MRGLPTTLHWGTCFVLALGLHVGGAAALLTQWSDEPAEAAGAPAIIIDMSPDTAMPMAQQEQPPGLEQSLFQKGETTPEPETPEKIEEVVETPPEEKPVEVAKVEPELEKPIDLKPEPVTQAELSILPPPKPKPPQVRKPPKQQARLASTRGATPQQAERVTASQPSAASSGSAVAEWSARIAAVIRRYTRYPSDARGDTGTARVAFSVDINGAVHGARLIGSSGSAALDREAIALMARVSALPAPPPEIANGRQAAVNVPIRFDPPR